MAPPKKTHCLRGHEYTPENSRPTPTGRACRACDAGRQRERYWSMKNTTQDALAVAELTLGALQKQYEAAPADHNLGRLVGEATNRLIALARAAAPKPVVERPTPPPPRPDEEEHLGRTPALCGGCGEKLLGRGYSVRYGDDRYRCSHCKFIGLIEEAS